MIFSTKFTVGFSKSFCFVRIFINMSDDFLFDLIARAIFGKIIIHILIAHR